MKKFCIYLLCGLLSCSVVSAAYYRSAHAMEWVGGALAFEEALKWGLALLGITATTGMTNAYWENYGDDFTDYAIENGATQQEVAEWQMKLCEGILDKGSAVWDKFKSWAFNLVNGNNSGSSSSGSFVSGGNNAIDVVNYINSLFSVDYSLPAQYENFTTFYCVFMDTGSNDKRLFLIPNTSISPYVNNGSVRLGSSVNYLQLYFQSNGDTGVFSMNGSAIGIVSNAFLSENISASGYGEIPFSDGNVSNPDDNFDSAFSSDIDNADVISSVLPDEDDAEVSLPYPGVSDSDNTASADAYDDIIDAINDGTITQEEGIEKIQELLKVIVYDDVTDDVLPNKPDDDTGENKKKDDVINENKENMGFSLAGLENVFPFCIPFDIYAFMTLLVADPVAPELDYPIHNVNGEVEEIHIDLSPFEPVAVVVRYVFDFLFIIGLGLLTRSLIGGGSSD